MEGMGGFLGMACLAFPYELYSIKKNTPLVGRSKVDPKWVTPLQRYSKLLQATRFNQNSVSHTAQGFGELIRVFKSTDKGV
jgi:hypothetical protein